MTEEPLHAAPCSPSVEKFLAEENRQLRNAGCKLAAAALHVAREYDGIHRLMLAVSEWATAVANEGGRGRANYGIHSKGTAMNPQKAERIRADYKLWQEYTQKWHNISPIALAEKFEVSERAIRRAISGLYQINLNSKLTQEDVDMIAELSEEALEYKAKAYAISPKQLAKKYKYGLTKIRKIIDQGERQ